MPIATNISGRSWKAFIRESTDHGWPSFRDEEVVWDNVRCLRNGECVTLDGIHLGHNLPDGSGNRLQASKIIPSLLLPRPKPIRNFVKANQRYCINLVSVAGQPPK